MFQSLFSTRYCFTNSYSVVLDSQKLDTWCKQLWNKSCIHRTKYQSEHVFKTCQDLTRLLVQPWKSNQCEKKWSDPFLGVVEMKEKINKYPWAASHIYSSDLTWHSVWKAKNLSRCSNIYNRVCYRNQFKQIKWNQVILSAENLCPSWSQVPTFP